MNRICEILGTEKPVVQGPMSWLTSPKLAAAVSEAGGLGVLGVGAGSCEPLATRDENNEAFRRAVRRTQELTGKPFGVNVMTAASDPGNHSPETLAIAQEEGVPVIVLVGNEFGDDEIDNLKLRGFTVIARQLNPTVGGAARLEALGADIVVATGCDTGGYMPTGHTGTMATVALFADALSVPVLAAGSIVNERFARASAVLGAEGAYVGTRFILSEECRAAIATKRNLLETAQDDFLVVTVNDGTGRWRTTPTPRAVSAAAANRAGDSDPDAGDYRRSELLGDLDAGFNSANSVVSLIRSIDPVAAIVDEIARGYE